MDFGTYKLAAAEK